MLNTIVGWAYHIVHMPLTWFSLVVYFAYEADQEWLIGVTIIAGILYCVAYS